MAARDLFRRRVVGEIERHQRLEARSCGQRREDALAIAQRPGRVVVTGGFRLGITIARANARAVSAAPAASCAPSRRCRCQSSGWVSVRRSRCLHAGIFRPTQAGPLVLRSREGRCDRSLRRAPVIWAASFAACFTGSSAQQHFEHAPRSRRVRVVRRLGGAITISTNSPRARFASASSHAALRRAACVNRLEHLGEFARERHDVARVPAPQPSICT